ncbi:hypothetical protein [Aquabacterium sp.]|uniref:hypothetical protein n=1 Tax=Aquabacterium sp. TaxID=1872578 RepID=UPI002C2D1EE6|nr:hypothetical protein [Aquabacterium sp.]HSW06088.1 hypothetical protein [Aquabacterium sp.]
MNDCTMTIPLYRPLWQRWLDAAQQGLGRLRRSVAEPAEAMLDLQAAIELNDKTLRDIGAPDWLRDQAATHRDLDSIALRAARADLGGGGVRWYG